MGKLIFTQLNNLIRGLSFHIFEPEESESHEFYDTKIVVHQHGPYPTSYKDIANEKTQAIIRIISAVPPEKLKLL